MNDPKRIEIRCVRTGCNGWLWNVRDVYVCESCHHLWGREQIHFYAAGRAPFECPVCTMNYGLYEAKGGTGPDRYSCTACKRLPSSTAEECIRLAAREAPKNLWPPTPVVIQPKPKSKSRAAKEIGR